MFLLHGPQKKVGNDGENAANYDNSEYNALFEQMKNMEDVPERQEIIDQMVRILRQDAPWIWGYHPKDYALYHEWYANVKPTRMSHNNMKYHRIDSNFREEKRLSWNKPVLWPLVVCLIVLIVGLAPAVITYRRKESGAGIRSTKKRGEIV